MAVRKKKTETAGTFVPAPRIPATPEAMLRNAIGELVEEAIAHAAFVMVEPVRGRRSQFSGDQQGERNTISFSYEHPREIALHELTIVDLRGLTKKVTEAYDYEGQEAAVEAMFMRADFPRLLTSMAREAASQVVAAGASTRTDTTLPEETADEIYDVISAASSTNYLAYDRNGETQKWAEYPSVYVRWSLWLVRSAVRDVSIKGPSLMINLNSIWSVESKKWSFDPEDLWPKQRGSLAPRPAVRPGRSAGVAAPHVVEIATVAGVPNRRVFVGEKKDASFYAAELGAWLVYFRAKAKVFASKHAADAWIAGHPRAKAKAVPA